MTLISTIIRDAYRESNLISISADPTAAESDEGVRILNRFISSIFGNEAGEELRTIPVGSGNYSRPSDFPGYTDQPESDWYVPMNSRLVLNLTSPQTVYLHPKPQDGSRLAIVDKGNNLATHNLTINANGYTVAGSNTSVVSTNGSTNEYFFRADTGNWALVSPLVPADESPFPSKFDDVLIIGLAIRLNPRNGVPLDAQTFEAWKNNLRKFRAQYSQIHPTRSELGLLKTSATKHVPSYNENDAFTYGRPYRW